MRSPTPALPRREGDTWGDRNLQRRVFKISLRLGTQGRLPCQRNKSYCNSYTLFKNKDNKMKLSFNKNNLPWMLIVLASLATFYGYNLLFHVVSNV